MNGDGKFTVILVIAAIIISFFMAMADGGGSSSSSSEPWRTSEFPKGNINRSIIIINTANGLKQKNGHLTVPVFLLSLNQPGGQPRFLPARTWK